MWLIGEPSFSCPESHRAKVDLSRRSKVLEKRGRRPIVYHGFNVSIHQAAVTIQMRNKDGNANFEVSPVALTY